MITPSRSASTSHSLSREHSLNIAAAFARRLSHAKHYVRRETKREEKVVQTNHSARSPFFDFSLAEN